MLSASEAAQILRFQAFLAADDARLGTWRAAIGAAVAPGDVVLDLGAGMGILSLFACQAGAARVYAVEHSPSIELARLVAADNGFAERIVCLRERSQDVELPEPATVLVTDTLDTFGLNGQLVSAALDARRRLLAPGARLLPDRIELRAAPVEAPAAYARLVDAWAGELQGFDVRAVRSFAANNKQPAEFGADALLAEPAPLGSVDLASAHDAAFAGAGRTIAARAGTAHGLGGFFSASLGGGLALSNDPRSPTTGYVRALLPLAEPLELAAGDELAIEVATDDGREWSWRVECTPAAGGPPQTHEHSTRHGFPRTPQNLLGRQRPAAS